MAGEAERADGFYRGTVALNVPVPGRRRDLVVEALDLWDHSTVLRGSAAIDRAMPTWMPTSWGIATDDLLPAMTNGGGFGSTWLAHFEPPTSDGATVLRIHVGPDGERGISPKSLPPEPALVVPLPPLPPAVRPATAQHDPTAELGPRDTVAPDYDAQIGRPLEVLPVGARLDDVVGRDIVVPSIQTYPTWFLLHLAGSGPLVDLMNGITMRRLRHQWTAEDDRGGRYTGTVKGAFSGFPWLIDAPFTPALDPEAASLALAFPNPFGSGVVSTEVRLR